MSMTINSVYNAYADSSTKAAEKKQATENTQNRQTQQADAPQLSSKAQAYLDKLNKSYDNMEFLVYNSGKDAKEVLSHSTKEVSVMLSREEIEKMASDEKYAAETMMTALPISLRSLKSQAGSSGNRSKKQGQKSERRKRRKISRHRRNSRKSVWKKKRQTVIPGRTPIQSARLWKQGA